MYYIFFYKDASRPKPVESQMFNILHFTFIMVRSV